jgi:mannose-6-phosphate isomerase-like protein (cupin superfamily)
MAAERLEPVCVPLAGRPVTAREDSPVLMRLARTLTRAEHGADVMVGVSWMEPGEESAEWSTEEQPPAEPGVHHVGPVHEFFFLLQGECTVEWEERELAFRPFDTFFFAPGWRYRIRNSGSEQAVLVYASTPPLG